MPRRYGKAIPNSHAKLIGVNNSLGWHGAEGAGLDHEEGKSVSIFVIYILFHLTGSWCDPQRNLNGPPPYHFLPRLILHTRFFSDERLDLLHGPKRGPSNFDRLRKLAFLNH